MKRKCLNLLTLALICLIVSPALAGEIKNIRLSDGSIIKGEVKQFDGSTYTIKSAKFGIIEVSDADVVSISSGTIHSTTSQIDPQNLKQQVGALQGTLMQDPDIMEDITSLLNDKEIMSIISDQEFMKTIMSYDVNKIENSAQTQELMNNPKFKAMMEKLGNKLDDKN